MKTKSSTKTKSDVTQVDYSMRTKANIFEYTGLSGSDAEFLGWQKTVSGELVPLYIITVANNPSYHSTVGESTLRKLCLRIPRTLFDSLKQIGNRMGGPMLSTKEVMTYVQDRNTVSEKKQLSSTDAKQIGNALGIRWDRFDVEQFTMGLNFELERRNPTMDGPHDDPIVTGRIALAHLEEIPNYYTQLAVAVMFVRGVRQGKTPLTSATSALERASSLR